MLSAFPSKSNFPPGEIFNNQFSKPWLNISLNSLLPVRELKDDELFRPKYLVLLSKKLG